MDYFDLKEFGKKMKEKRKHMNFTLKELSDLTLVNYETISRIENGKVIPKLETLDYLSIYYKMDLTSYLIEFHRTNDKELNNIMIKINPFFYNFEDDYIKLKLYLSELIEIQKNMDNKFYKIHFKQIIILIKGVLKYKLDNDYKESLKLFIDGIKIGTINFEMENYKKYYYIDMEIIMLNYIVEIYYKLNKKAEAIDILEFIIENWFKFHRLYYITILNLIKLLKNNKEYNKSLEYIEKGIILAREYNNLEYLNRFYFEKYKCEKILNIENATESLNIAKILYIAYDDKNLKNIIDIL